MCISSGYIKTVESQECVQFRKGFFYITIFMRWNTSEYEEIEHYYYLSIIIDLKLKNQTILKMLSF